MVTDDPELREYMDWLLREHGEAVDFVVLYGSRARGTHKPGSDYDLLIGLKTAPAQTLDLVRYQTVPIEAKAYGPEQLDTLWFRYKRILLDPLYEGIVLLDRGPWAIWQQRFKDVMDRGILEHDGPMWLWHKEREPTDSPRLEEDRRLRALPW